MLIQYIFYDYDYYYRMQFCISGKFILLWGCLSILSGKQDKNADLKMFIFRMYFAAIFQHI